MSIIAMIDVSVVTVVKNAFQSGTAAFLRQCLASVQAQSGVTIEHIVVDGVSKDGTVEILKNAKAVNHAYRWLSEPDEGIYSAMNKGLQLAKGRYVTFLNADDFYHSGDGLKMSVQMLDSAKADFSYAPAIVIRRDGANCATSPHVHPDLRNLLKGMPFSHQSVLVRTELMKQMGGFCLDYFRSADYAFIMTLIFDGRKAIRVEKDFVTFRTGGFSGQNPAENQREHVEAFDRLSRRYLGHKLLEGEFKAYVYACVLRTFGAASLRDGWYGTENLLAPLIAERFREVCEIKQSAAYRVGSVLVWPLKKVGGGMKCLRENGVKYTIKHALGKITCRIANGKRVAGETGQMEKGRSCT